MLLGLPAGACAARRQDSELEWPVGVGIALALLLMGVVFNTARDGADEFTLMQGAGDADMRSAELTRLQDWVLLEDDLRRPSLGSESQPAVTASWSTPASFIQNAGESGNARDLELRARYRRLLSTGDADPLLSLAKPAGNEQAAELRGSHERRRSAKATGSAGGSARCGDGGNPHHGARAHPPAPKQMGVGDVASLWSAYAPVMDRNRYILHGEFARGGMGRILRAYDVRLGRMVALKELQLRKGP